MDRATQFREAAARLNRGRGKNGWRYSEELKILAVEHCWERHAAGQAWRAIAEDLGVSTVTLSRWMQEKPGLGGFRPVAVVETKESEVTPPAPLAVVTPGGLRIEGLAWPQVLELASAFR